MPIPGCPNKAEREVSFVADIVPQNDTEASLGFGLYLRERAKVAGVAFRWSSMTRRIICLMSIPVSRSPVERGKTTIIRGEYLTNRKEPGIGIDPGFDGDITIVLPD